MPTYSQTQAGSQRLESSQLFIFLPDVPKETFSVLRGPMVFTSTPLGFFFSGTRFHFNIVHKNIEKLVLRKVNITGVRDMGF